MNRPQVVRMGGRTHPPHPYATLVPHRDVCSGHSCSRCSPPLCSAKLSSDIIFKMRLMQPSWDVLQRGSQEHFQHSTWGDDINLSLNVSKIKEMIVDHRKSRRGGWRWRVVRPSVLHLRGPLLTPNWRRRRPYRTFTAFFSSHAYLEWGECEKASGSHFEHTTFFSWLKIKGDVEVFLTSFPFRLTQLRSHVHNKCRTNATARIDTKINMIWK